MYTHACQTLNMYIDTVVAEDSDCNASVLEKGVTLFSLSGIQLIRYNHCMIYES